MKPTQALHDLGQSLWLDHITRDLLDDGTLKRYVDELSVTGLTSNPTIFAQALKNSRAYDPAIARKTKEGRSGEELFFELAIEDLGRAADIFRPVHDRTAGVDGFVSLEVSPVLAHDTESTLAAAKELHARAGRKNLLIRDPRDDGGPPRHRGGHLRRDPRERDAPLLARALPRRRRRLLPRDRAAHRGRARPVRRVGRLGVHQPLGRGRRRQGARGAREPARHRNRGPDPRHLPGDVRLAPLATRLQHGRAPAAPALGEHRDEGSQGAPTRSTSTRSRPPSP